MICSRDQPSTEGYALGQVPDSLEQERINYHDIERPSLYHIRGYGCDIRRCILLRCSVREDNKAVFDAPRGNRCQLMPPARSGQVGTDKRATGIARTHKALSLASIHW
jgi:hypothetical protein